MLKPALRVLGSLALLHTVACSGTSDDEGASDCPSESCEDVTSTGGDGDGDATGDGDGDATGDGDGDATGDGDGDGEPSCHPLMITCPIGETCNWDGAEFRCVPSMIKLGDSCVPDTPQCVSGFCAAMELVPGCPSTHCCAGFCNLDSPFCSIEGTSCVDYFPPGATTPEVGACLQ